MYTPSSQGLYLSEKRHFRPEEGGAFFVHNRKVKMGDTAIFKIFLNVNDTVEVKKFSIGGDTSVITNYIFMREKLQIVFPRLRECDFKITWRDADGDDITIENDEDLIFALTEMEDPVKVLHVTVLAANYSGEPQFAHPPLRTSSVVCDVCNKTITSYRYKCLQCYDYDLCADCEHAGHHSHHMILRTSTPELPFTRCGRKLFEQVNKAVRKANHVAYKECKKRWPKGDRKRGEQPAGESSAKQESQQQPSQGCPFQDYVPNIYPFIDAIATAAASTASAAANAASSAAQATTSTATGQQESTTQTNSTSAPQMAAQEQNAAAQFMEAIRNVISSFAVPPQQTQNSETKQTQQPQQETQQTPTAPTDINIDLTTSTPEPMDVGGSQREPGWTLLSSEETQQHFQVPVLTPTVVPTPQPVNPPVVPPQPVQQPVQENVAPTQPRFSPMYPVLPQQNYFVAQQQDPVIAMGLQKLLEMGFTDEPSLIALLKRYDGNVDQVIKHIFEHK